MKSEEEKEYQKEYRKKNRGKLLKYKKEHYLNNKERHSKTAKRYYLEHKDKINEINKLYYQKNKKVRIKKIREWQKNNPDRFREIQRKGQIKFSMTPKGIYSILKTNSLKRKMKFDLSQEAFINWYNNQKKNCYYCGINEKNLEWLKKEFPIKNNVKRLTIERKNNNIGYQLNNIVLACQYCNKAKSNLFNEKEMKLIAEQFIKPKWIKYKNYDK